VSDAAKLIKTALEFYARKPWLECEEDDAVVLDIPGFDRPFAACICGQGGQERGMVLFRDGLAGMDEFLEEEGFAGGVDQLILLISPLRDVPPPLRRLLEEARWRGRRETLAPHLIVKRPGKFPRGPRKNEIRAALYAVRAVLAALGAGDLDMRWYGSAEGVQRLRLSGPPHAPSYELGTAVLERDAGAVEPVSLPEEEYGEAEGVWAVGLLPLDASVQGDERTAGLVLVADADSGRVLHHALQMGHDLDEAARDVAAWIAERRALPGEVQVLNSGLHDRLSPALRALGVPCRRQPDQPLLREITAGLSASMGDPEDLAAADFRVRHDELVEAMSETVRRHPRDEDRALARYFGTARLGRELIKEDREALLESFFVWQWTLYRPRPESKTILERTLERDDLPDDVREVGEAIRAARPSLYRIESLDPPHVALLDLASGEEIRVRDHGLARTGHEGLVLPAVVIRTEAIDALQGIGPPLSAVQAGAAFDYLESKGIPVTPEGLSANPHFGGRLAAWSRKDMPRRPVLQNTEGEALSLHTAEFVADDPQAAANAFHRNPDMDWDEQDGTFVWLGREAPDGGRLVRGRIEILDDHLVLECNSAGRFAAGRAMLEAIPGVRFESVRERGLDLDDLDAGIPADDLPAIGEAPDALDQENLPPEVAAFLRDQFAAHQMEWIDSEIPMFEGRTPRALCRTSEGRRRVRHAILTMPTPHPSLAGEPMAEIRKRMFEELGLED